MKNTILFMALVSIVAAAPILSMQDSRLAQVEKRKQLMQQATVEICSAFEYLRNQRPSVSDHCPNLMELFSLHPAGAQKILTKIHSQSFSDLNYVYDSVDGVLRRLSRKKVDELQIELFAQGVSGQYGPVGNTITVRQGKTTATCTTSDGRTFTVDRAAVSMRLQEIDADRN